VLKDIIIHICYIKLMIIIKIDDNINIKYNKRFYSYNHLR